MQDTSFGNYADNVNFKRLPKPKTLNDINPPPRNVGRRGVNFEQNVVYLKQSMKEKDDEIFRLIQQLRIFQSDNSKKDELVVKYKLEIDKLKQNNSILQNEVQLYRERKSLDSENHIKIAELQSSEREAKRLLKEEREINQRNREKLMKIKQHSQSVTFQMMKQKQFAKELKKKVRKQKERKNELKMRIKQYIEGNVNQFQDMQNAIQKMKEVNRFHSPDELNKLYELVQNQHSYMKKLRAKYRKAKKEKHEKIEDLKNSKKECISLIKNHDKEISAYVKRIRNLERMLEKTTIKLQSLNKSIHVARSKK